MPAAKQTEPDATNKSLEMNIERNVRALNRAGDEMAANTIATLLRRACKASTCEIDNLIGEFRGLREKLTLGRVILPSWIDSPGKKREGGGCEEDSRPLTSLFVGVGWLLRALFVKQHADALTHGLIRDGLQQPLKVLDVQALNEPIHDAPPRNIFPRL